MGLLGCTSISPGHTNTNTRVVTPLVLNFVFLTEFSMNFDAESRKSPGDHSSTPPYISFLYHLFPCPTFRAKRSEIRCISITLNRIDHSVPAMFTLGVKCSREDYYLINLGVVRRVLM